MEDARNFATPRKISDDIKPGDVIIVDGREAVVESVNDDTGEIAVRWSDAN